MENEFEDLSLENLDKNFPTDKKSSRKFVARSYEEEIVRTFIKIAENLDDSKEVKSACHEQGFFLPVMQQYLFSNFNIVVPEESFYKNLSLKNLITYRERSALYKVWKKYGTDETNRNVLFLNLKDLGRCVAFDCFSVGFCQNVVTLVRLEEDSFLVMSVKDFFEHLESSIN